MSQDQLLEVPPMQEREMCIELDEERCKKRCKDVVQEEVVEEGSDGQGQIAARN